MSRNVAVRLATAVQADLDAIAARYPRRARILRRLVRSPFGLACYLKARQRRDA